MRKVICNQCALDWQVQHCCKNGVSTASPTAIYEPDPPASILYHADLKASSCPYCNVNRVELCPKCDLIEARELLSKLAIAKEALTFIYQGGAKPFESKDLAHRMLAMSSKAGEALERLKDIKK